MRWRSLASHRRWPLSSTSLHSVRVFHGIVERERQRVDRNRGCSSLAVFEPWEPPRRAANGSLEPYLQKKLRTTDQTGWFDERRIGVLLSDTSAQGAERFVERVTGPKAALSLYRVTTYLAATLREDVGASEEASAGADSPSAKAPDRPAAIRAATELDSLRFPGIPLWKRALDLCGAGLGLVLLLPLLLAVSGLIKLVSPGPVFFRQTRIGYRERPFAIWKFRTIASQMASRAHEQHVHALKREAKPLRKIDGQLRLIPLGHFLRYSFIDELPQLFNVLRGEMSLVGPRPDIPYPRDPKREWHRLRFAAVPGMTGLWQVSGKNTTTFDEMIRLDIRYARQMSPLLDLSILCKTIPTVVAETRGYFLRNASK